MFYRLTDNWLELTVHFTVREHGIRELKDRMAREVAALFGAKIGIASATYQILGRPPIEPKPTAESAAKPLQK